jgi:hypothetical protein
VHECDEDPDFRDETTKGFEDLPTAFDALEKKFGRYYD